MSLAACTPVTTGGGFLKGSLAYLDCAGRTIGSVGYFGLTQPGSVIFQLILTAVTLFIAWQGIRMMFGRTPDIGDAVLSVAKIGLVLMLVTSWPAVRTLVAEPAFAGPVELAAQTRIQGPLGLEDRLQRADDGIVALTKWGTGKLDIRAGRTANGQPAASEFAGVALTDDLALGLGRLSFLVGSLMSLGLMKLLVGVTISALPIFAGLLLFDTTRGLFLGWLRLVFALVVASFAIPLILTVELSLLEPWLARAIEQRASFYATPSAPTELLAVSGSFLLILIGAMALIARACFGVDPAAVARGIGHQAEGKAQMNQNEQLPLGRPVGADRSINVSRAESLAMTLNLLDRSSRDPVFGTDASATRPANNGAAVVETGRSGRNPAMRRVKQRMALSHARRNQL
jgi:type IV secretion system protein VirB6